MLDSDFHRKYLLDGFLGLLLLPLKVQYTHHLGRTQSFSWFTWRDSPADGGEEGVHLQTPLYLQTPPKYRFWRSDNYIGHPLAGVTEPKRTTVLKGCSSIVFI